MCAQTSFHALTPTEHMRLLAPLFHLFYANRVFDAPTSDLLPKFRDLPGAMGGSDELLDSTGKPLGKATVAAAAAIASGATATKQG